MIEYQKKKKGTIWFFNTFKMEQNNQSIVIMDGIMVFIFDFRHCLRAELEGRGQGQGLSLELRT